MTLNITESQQLQSLAQEVTTLTGTVDTLLSLIQQSGGQGGDIAAHEANKQSHADSIKHLPYIGSWQNGTNLALNDFIGPDYVGRWAFNANNGPANRPAARPGHLVVFTDTTNASTMQIWFERGSLGMSNLGRIYMRLYYTGTWSDWTDFQSTAWKNVPNGYVGLDSSGRLTIGDPTPGPGVGIKAVGTDAAAARIGAIRVVDGAPGASVSLWKARGTFDNLQPPIAGDVLGAVIYAYLTGTTTSSQRELAIIYGRLSANANMAVAYPDSYFNFQGGGNTSAAVNQLFIHSDKVTPGRDNAQSFGSPDLRISQVYAAQGSINTSDARLKTETSGIPENLLEAWGKQVSPCLFQWLDSIEEKGTDKARIHSGFIAQQVEKAFKAAGFDPARYAAWCYDEWDDEYESEAVIDQEEENGKRKVNVADDECNTWVEEREEPIQEEKSHTEQRLVRKKGNRYSLRPDQILTIEAAYQRWRADMMDDELTKIKSEQATMMAKLQELEERL